MNKTTEYGKEYFKTVYARMKKEKRDAHQAFFKLIQDYVLPGSRVLDLGCSEGDFLQICQEKKCRCYGADIAAYALGQAKKKIQGDFRQIDLTKDKLPWPDSFFDVITLLDVVEHIRETSLLFKEIRRVVKKNGRLLITTPNQNYWLKPILRLITSDDPTHINIRDSRYWQKHLSQNGWKDILIKGCVLFGFPPGMEIRHWLKKANFPVVFKPIFSRLLPLTSTLFIGAAPRPIGRG